MLREMDRRCLHGDDASALHDAPSGRIVDAVAHAIDAELVALERLGRDRSYQVKDDQLERMIELVSTHT